jgi:predicted O-methyltransferase YrrM
MQITKKDIVVIFIVSGILLFSTIGIRWWIGQDALIITVIFSNIFVLFVLFETYRRVEKRDRRRDERLWNSDERSRNNSFRQIEALFSIFFSIKPNYPLPNTKGWAASPDFLKKLLEVIYREEPKLVVEASSGVTTLIIAYCLKQIGSGQVISLEHDAQFAKVTEDLISLHGLEDIAKVVHAPLKEIEINANKWLWYDTEYLDTAYLKASMPIDLLVIDGPPAHTPELQLARYPALPLLFKHLLDESTIILDDGARKGEQEIVGLWKKELEYISYEWH